MYVTQKYASSLDWIMLEIKLPRDIFKSPLATELAIAAFLQSSGASTTYARNYEGKFPHYGSLEIASIEGVIHFYIRVQRRFRTLMETNFYSQYPGIEIVEADDYTKLIRFHHLSKDTYLWGMNYRPGANWKPVDPKTGQPFPHPTKKKKKYEMKADFLPIKTYVDYELDKNPDEEFKIDPLTPLLETMGSLGKGEHMWYQVILQDESVYNGTTKLPKFYVNKVNHERFSLSELAEARKKELRTSGYIKRGDVAYNEYGEVKEKTIGKDADGKDIKAPQTYTFADPEMNIKALPKKDLDLTTEEKDEIEVINRKVSKPLAPCVVRIVYISKKENWNPGHVATTVTFPKAFTGANKLVAMTLTDPYDYPWENIGKRRGYWRSEETFEAYVEREGLYAHIPKRDSLEEWEDRVFWSFSMKQRKLFRMVFEAIFYPFSHPEPEEAFVANLEEIATLWHLPGAVAGTPTLPRIESNKGVAPSNLPI